MQIDLSRQSNLLHGIARVVRQGEAWHPARMTAALEKNYGGTEAYLIRAACTAGVRLALQTDAPVLNIGLQYRRSCRNLSQCDVLIDGRPAAPLLPAPADADFTAAVPLPGGGPHVVEIYLPHCREVLISRLEIPDGATAAPRPRPPNRWLAVGDSITQGMTATSPALTWTARVARQLGWDLHNIAVGGAIAQAAVGRLALDLAWNIATVAFGVNDFNQDRPPDVVQAETRGLLERLLQRPQAALYLLTPVPWAGRTTPNNIGLHLEDYRQALRQAAAGLPRVAVIEGAELLDDNPALFADNVHPNDTGMAQFAERLAGRLPHGATPAAAKRNDAG